MLCGVSAACDGSLLQPTEPSRYSDNFSGMKSALLCVEEVESYLAVDDDDKDLCTGAEDWHASRGCRLDYNVRMVHTCADGGWPAAGLDGRTTGGIRVRMSVSAFRGDEMLGRRRDLRDIGPGEWLWLCGEDGKVAEEECYIVVSGEDIQRAARGNFEVERRWNACWLEYRPTGGGLGCYPDPDYPEFPSGEDRGVGGI